MYRRAEEASVSGSLVRQGASGQGTGRRSIVSGDQRGRDWLHAGEIFQMNVEKLKSRYPDGFDAEHSIHRREDDV